MLISTIFEKFLRGRNVIIKNQDIRYIIKHCIKSKDPVEFIMMLMKYLNFKDNGGARTSFQIKQVYDLLIYTIDLFSNKINKNSDKLNKNQKTEDNKNKQKINHASSLSGQVQDSNKNDNDFNKYLKYDSLKLVLATITSRLKEKNTSSQNQKDDKILYQCILNFLHKLFFFMKKNKVASSSDDIANFNKSITFIINSSKAIIKDIPDLKSMNEKLLDIEESLSK